MPVIRVSQKTWDRLRAHATPLEHTANDVVSMALDALVAAKLKKRRITPVPTPEPEPKKARQATGRFSQKELRILLLETLFGLGGDASTSDIRASLNRVLAPVLTDVDCEIVSNGNPRWWNSVCAVRNELTMEGLLRGNSKRGVWELSRSGRSFLSARIDRITHLRRGDRG